MVIDILKNNHILKGAYKKYNSFKARKNFKPEQIPHIIPSFNKDNGIRYNLLLPTLRATGVYGGISTAIKFTNILSRDVKCRIIVCSEEIYSDKYTYKIDGFNNNESSSKSLWFRGSSNRLPVSKNDIFIFTSWKTELIGEKILKWQFDTYNLTNRNAIYLIQDFEPGFYAWSTEYAMAESTYRNIPNHLTAVFNSSQLKDYFKNNGYKFNKELYFEPRLNEKLKEFLLQNKNINNKRKKRIIVYGRPNENRNAFEIIRSALAIWSENYMDSSEWELISLGAEFENIKLKNNTIISKGKVSLEEYANYMLTSYAGISLMISPHPSYPPLEMSTFGIRTITNNFANKDLSYFNKNIVSINNCSPLYIYKVLKKLCDQYEDYNSDIILEDNYLNNDSLKIVANDVKQLSEAPIL